MEVTWYVIPNLHLVWRGLLLFSLILSLTTTKHDLWYLMQSTNPGGRAY